MEDKKAIKDGEKGVEAGSKKDKKDVELVIILY
jgi:hypothetical protein